MQAVGASAGITMFIHKAISYSLIGLRGTLCNGQKAQHGQLNIAQEILATTRAPSVANNRPSNGYTANRYSAICMTLSDHWCLFSHQLPSNTDEFFNRDDRKSMLSSKGMDILTFHHGAIGIH